MYAPGLPSYQCPPLVSWRRWLSPWELLERMLAEEKWLESYESLKRQFDLMAVDVGERRFLTQDKFESFIAQMNPRWARHVSDILFPLMDCDADGFVNLQDFAVTMLSTFLEGTFVSSSTSAYFRARRQLLFTFYDMDGRGFLSQADWHRIVEDSMEYWTRHEKAVQQRPELTKKSGCTADMIMCMESLTQSPRESWNESASKKLMRLNAFWKDENGVINYDSFYEACDRRLISDRGIRLRFKNLPLQHSQSFDIMQKTLVAGVEATQSLVQRAVRTLPKFGLQLWTIAADLRNSNPPSSSPPIEEQFAPPPLQPSQASSPIVAAPLEQPLVLSPDPVKSASTIVVSPEEEVPCEFAEKAPPMLVPTTTASEAEELLDSSTDFPIGGDSVVTPFMKEQELCAAPPNVPQRIVELYLHRCVAFINGHLTITDPAGDEGQALLNDLMTLAYLVQKHCTEEQLVLDFHQFDLEKIWVVGALNGDIADTQQAMRTVLEAPKVVPSTAVIPASSVVVFSGNVLNPGGATISSLQVLACVWTLKAMFPERVVLLRGANEAGLQTDVGKALMDAFGVERSARLFNRICDTWESTSLALMAGQAFCVFGGCLTLPLLARLVDVKAMGKPLVLDSKAPGDLELIIRDSYSTRDVEKLAADRYCVPGAESLPKIIVEQSQLTFGIHVRPIKNCVNMIQALKRTAGLAEMTEWATERLMALG